MSLQKEHPIRSKSYLKWVKSLDCCLCGAPADTYHHIIGIGDGGTGTKACDLLTMPVCVGCHIPKFHRLDLYPELRDEQWKYVSKTLQKAIKEGAIPPLDV